MKNDEMVKLLFNVASEISYSIFTPLSFSSWNLKVSIPLYQILDIFITFPIQNGNSRNYWWGI